MLLTYLPQHLLSGRGPVDDNGDNEMFDRQDTVQHIKKEIQGSDDTNDRNARGEKVPKGPPEIS